MTLLMLRFWNTGTPSLIARVMTGAVAGNGGDRLQADALLDLGQGHGRPCWGGG